MASKNPLASKYIKELIKKFPNHAKLTLAKKAYKDEPKLFTSVETARNSINYYMGAKGDKYRNQLADKSLVKPITNITNPYNLDKSEAKTQRVWNLPTANKKVLILSDIHFPYHDVEAITGALNYGKKQGIDTIFINGDMLDFYQLSFHEKDPRKTSIPDELEMGRNFFKSLRKNFPKANIYYIIGNHEYRMQRYLRVKAPELLDMEEFRMDMLLNCREHDIIYLEYGTKCYMGKLLVEHGDKMRGSGGVNPARTLLLKLKRHALCGHFHRTTNAIEKVYDGDNIIAYSTGCLCELEPDYMAVNNHNHGFAIVTMLGGGNFSVENKTIVNGKVY